MIDSGSFEEMDEISDVEDCVLVGLASAAVGMAGALFCCIGAGVFTRNGFGVGAAPQMLDQSDSEKDGTEILVDAAQSDTEHYVPRERLILENDAIESPVPSQTQEVIDARTPTPSDPVVIAVMSAESAVVSSPIPTQSGSVACASPSASSTQQVSLPTDRISTKRVVTPIASRQRNQIRRTVPSTFPKRRRASIPMVIPDNITITTHTASTTEYHCNVCIRTFKTKGNVKYHAYCGHGTGEKPYQCSHGQCAKSFVSKSQYKLHLLTHTDVRPYSCEVCTKGFRQKDKLNRHMITHSSERPHVCGVCQRGFLQDHNLNLHLKTHTGRQFVCEVCRTDFVDLAGYNRHVQRHHGKKPNGCPVCSNHYTRKDNMQRHMKKKHPVEQEALRTGSSETAATPNSSQDNLYPARKKFRKNATI